jgi:uncharacterized membrane protein
MRVLRASLAAFLLLVGLAPAVFAATISMTTPYPSVVADPGTTVKFPVTVQTDTSTRVDVSVSQQPQGWTTRLSGGGSTIAAVETVPFLAPTSAGATPQAVNGFYATFTAEITVPADATAADNQIIVQGKAADGTTTTLTLDITVQTAQTGDVTLSTDFPSLTGPTSTNFKFQVTLQNNTNQQITFGLETDQPDGWTVTANPTTEAQAANVAVDAGSSTQISVSATAPTDAAAGPYTVTLRALGGPQPVEQALTVNLTGTYSMSLATSDQRLNVNVTAGQASTMNFVITNSGTTDLTGVTMTSTPPIDWTVTFTPTSIDIPAGQTATVQAAVTPANSALAGDYQMTIDARNPDSSASDSVQIRATVETSPIGYIIGIAILVLVGIGLFFVFQRYGRR